MTKKTLGFYLSAISAVLALVSVILYGNVFAASSSVRPMLIVSIVVSVLVLALTAVKGKFPGGNLLPVLSAVLVMGGVASSFGPMANTVVFEALGMYTTTYSQAYFTFVGVGAAAWVVSVIAAFSGIAKKADK